MKALMFVLLIVLASMFPPNATWSCPLGQGRIVVPIGAYIWVSLIVSAVLTLLSRWL